MSLVIAIKDKDKIIVGCDTRINCGNGYLDSYHVRPKAVHINQETILACCGNIGILDMMKDTIEKMESISKSTLTSELIPYIIKNLRNTPFFDEGTLDGDLLIAYKNKCFIICGNLTILEVVDSIAIGSGAMVALGYLKGIKEYEYTPEVRILKTIEATAEMISSVSSEAYIGDTKSNKIVKTIRKNIEKNR